MASTCATCSPFTHLKDGAKPKVQTLHTYLLAYYPKPISQNDTMHGVDDVTRARPRLWALLHRWIWSEVFSSGQQLQTTKTAISSFVIGDETQKL